MVKFEEYAKSTYDWEPGHEKELRITKSSLTSDFDFCPKQYEYTRIEGRKSPETEDMRRGTNVHDAVETFFINVRPSVQKILAKAKEGKDEEAFGLMLKCLPEPEEPYALGEEDILQTRLEWEYARLLACDGEDYLPIMNEEEVHVHTTRKVTVNGEEYVVPIHLAGMIDRGFRTEEGNVAIMELKTGKWPVGSSYKVTGMRREMAFYAHLLKEADHPYKHVSHWGWMFPGGDRLGLPNTAKHWDYEKVKQRSISAMLKKMDTLIEAHIINEFPPAPSEGKCAHCDFMEECPAWGADGDRYWSGLKGRHKK